MKNFIALLLTLTMLFSLALPVLADEPLPDEENETVSTDIDPTQIEPAYDPKTDGWTIITLDPGHGGSGGGSYKWNGKWVCETEIVLKIAYYLKAELEQYYRVKVFLTRETNEPEEYMNIYEIAARCDIAAANHSDLLVSLHINGSDRHNVRGASVLVPNGNYRPELAAEDCRLASLILAQLNALGIPTYNKGLITRDSETRPPETYPDGSVADYYGIVRGGILYDMPAVLVEHCFVDNYYDVMNFLSTDEQLKALAHADCMGIVEFLDLKTPDEIPEEPLVTDPDTSVSALTDIETCWAKDYIDRAVVEGWVKGYLDHTFRPKNNVTRGEFVTFLGRAAGVPDVCNAQVFPDVTQDRFCAAFVQWAAENGIVEGYEDGYFRPDKNITREQMAKIMTRYLALLGHDVYGVYDIHDFAIGDLDAFSAWAPEYVAYCYANGLLQGTKEGVFEPRRNATRAEACAVLVRMIDFDINNPVVEPSDPVVTSDPVVSSDPVVTSDDPVPVTPVIPTPTPTEPVIPTPTPTQPSDPVAPTPTEPVVTEPTAPSDPPVSSQPVVTEPITTEPFAT